MHSSGTFVESPRQIGLNRRDVIKIGLLTTIAAWTAGIGYTCAGIFREVRFMVTQVDRTRDEGFIGLHYPEKYSGSDYGCLENVLVVEEFCRADSSIGENVYIGPMCHIGLVDIERDVLLAAGVHVPSGPATHGIDDR